MHRDDRAAEHRPGHEMCDCYECRRSGRADSPDEPSVSFKTAEYAAALALDVKAAAIVQLDERRKEFELDMLGLTSEHGKTDEELLALTDDEVHSLYQKHYDIIWLGGSAREGDDEYLEGYERGAWMVLEHLHRVFKILPPY